MTDTVTPANDTQPAETPALDTIKAKLNGNETIAKAKAFAKERPWAVATAAGVIGLALLNTLRGKR